MTRSPREPMSVRRDGDVLLRITPDTRTPCCSRVPKHIGGRRYACRACGLTYVDTIAVLRAHFGDVVDVTSMTPSRFRKG